MSDPETRSWRGAVDVLLALLLACSSLCVSGAYAQGTVERRLALRSGAAVKMFVPAGSLRLVEWDRDTLVVRAVLGRGSRLFFGGGSAGAKVGVESDDPTGAASARVEVRVPRGVTVSVKTVSASVDAQNVSGWFYTVDGGMRLRGRVSTVEVEAMSGAADVDVVGAWARVRTASGPLTLGGRVQDVGASSVSGRLLVTTTGIERGRIGSVSGTVTFAGAAAPGGVLELDDHSGAVEFRVPPAQGGEFQLTTVVGTIDNRVASIRPTALASGRGQSLAFRLGTTGGRVTVRTYRGAIVLRRP